jgi:four helix bundle protein
LKKLIFEKSRIFNKRIYEITNGEEFKRFDLVRQIRRASTNFIIAEGFERKHG